MQRATRMVRERVVSTLRSGSALAGLLLISALLPLLRIGRVRVVVVKGEDARRRSTQSERERERFERLARRRRVQTGVRRRRGRGWRRRLISSRSGGGFDSFRRAPVDVERFGRSVHFFNRFSSIIVIIQRRDATNVMSTRANGVVTTTSVSASPTGRRRRERPRRRARASSVEDADGLSSACASVDSWAIRAARESDLDGIVRA